MSATKGYNQLAPTWVSTEPRGEDPDLKCYGFKRLGRNVQIDETVTLLGVENIEIGDDVRIDSFSMILANGPLRIGSNVHISPYCLLAAAGGIELCDFAGLSAGVKVYSANDDYTGGHLTCPTVPTKYRGITKAPVVIGRHCVIGANTVILPGVTIGDGSSVGAQSLVTKSLDPWGVYFGSPVKRLKSRSKRLLALEAQYLEEKRAGTA